MSFRHRRLPLLLPLAALVALGACRDREPEQPDIENESIVTEPVIPDNAAPPPEPEIVPENTQVAPKPAPPPEIPDDQQVLDDAAAVGMTARLPRGERAYSEEKEPAGEKAELAEDNGQALDPIY
ncbi:MAG: hypothetical protein AB7E05_01820 [Sphingobium sp.]